MTIPIWMRTMTDLNHEDPWDVLLGDSETQGPITGSYTKERSSTIAWASFDGRKQIFAITFHASPKLRYVFYRVPREVGEGFFEAAASQKSIGRFFQTKIKTQFSFLKEEEKPQFINAVSGS